MTSKNFPTKLDSKTSCLRITVPENLDLALEGLIRKVLKEQPKTDNIYSFAANYFETLLKIRDQAGAKFTADQLCPFHNDEDAHEMIKIAGTFSKPGTEKFKKKNEESFLSRTQNVAKNNDLDSKIQNKQNFYEPKLKKVSKDEKPTEQNKPATHKVIKKLPMTIKNAPEEEKKQTKLVNKRSDDDNLEKNTEKEESDDEEFLASDPIKELVEKELMETNLSGKKEKISENIPTNTKASMLSEGLITNKTIQEEQKPTDNINVHSTINDASRPLEEENRTSKENLTGKDRENNKNEKIEETKAAKEREVTIENEEVTEQSSEKRTSDAKEEEKDKTVNAEANNKRIEDVEEENKESVKNKEKSSGESTKGTTEIDEKSTTNLSVSKEETKNVEMTNANTENTEEEKIVTDKTSDIEAIKPERSKPEREVTTEYDEVREQPSERSTSDAKEEERNRTIDAEANNKRFENVEEENKESAKNKEKSRNLSLTQEIQTEQKIETPSKEMENESTDESSDALKDANKAVSNEIFKKENTIDVDQNVKEQEEKNVIISEEITHNEVKTEEKESKEPLNDQQSPRVSSKVDTERQSKSSVEIAAKDDSSEGDKTVETSVINTKSSIKEQDAKMQDKKITDNETLPIVKIEATDVGSLEGNEPTREVIKRTEEIKNENNATLTEEQPKLPAQIEELLADETESKQHIFKIDEKPLETKEIVENNKNENTVQNAEEHSEEALESRTTVEETVILEQEEQKEQEIPGQVINTNEKTVDTKTELESTMSQKVSKNNFLKDKSNDFSSANKESNQREDEKPETSSQKLLLGPTNPNEVIKPEKEENSLNSYRVKSIEDALFGEKTEDLPQSIDVESLQAPDEQAQKEEIPETQKDQKDVNQNLDKSELTNKEIATEEEEENIGKLEEEVSTSLNLLNAIKPDKEKPNEVLMPGTPVWNGTPSKNKITELGKESGKEESSDQKPYVKAEDEGDQTSEGKTKEEELYSEIDTYQILKEEETDNEKSKVIRIFKISSENGEEDHSKVEEELCTVVDVEQIPKDAIDRNKLEEKYQPEAETIQNKEDKTKIEERTTEEKSFHVITVEDTEKTEENQEMPQSSGEMQIKTIQSHYYNTLQVPEKVTKEYRVHNISSPSVGTLLTVASSLQQSYEPKYELLNKEEQNAKMVDTNMNSPLLTEKELFPTELTETVTATENLNSDNVESEDHLKISKAVFPPEDVLNQNELELDTPKSNSDDLLDIMTPTSSYSLNLSELSWQTVNELFLDTERRNSSLEKEAIRYATPKTSKTMEESAEPKPTENRQEIEEIIQKTVVSSRREAVPVPPRDIEADAETSETVEEEKKEDKPENESTESSSDSSNEQISVNDDTPFISVEVKTVIETQILNDDDDEDDQIRNQEQNREEKMQPDMEIKIETTVDFQDEIGTTQSESEPKEDKTETAFGTKRNGLKATQEIQPKNGHYKLRESSSAEQTTGEGSSGESESTTSSAATKIRRENFAKRNFSSTQSLLSTQSLDLEKKNPLMKTRSLSTFRHGVTDFEVWNKIEKELEEAATKIQSKYRGYKTRKKLQRENAMQITTEESSVSGTSVEAEVKNECQQSTGEFHDSIVLSEHPR